MTTDRIRRLVSATLARAVLLGFALLASSAASAQGLALGEVRAGLIEGRPALAVEIEAAALRAPQIRVTADPPLTFGASVITPDRDGGGALVLLPVVEGLPEGTALAGRRITLEIADGDRRLSAAATVAPGGAPRTTGDRLATALSLLGLAFLGGLILNGMPCVLPVLCLKLAGLAGHAGAPPARIRAGFLASAAGILASFLVLALGLILLRRAGGLVGWGIQFQQPAFVAGLAVVTGLFALNLWGLFAIGLPGPVSGRLGRAGQDRGLAGAFATGFFATLLATPCSAPFLGTAVGFALVRDPPVIVAVLLTVGLGLATPYLAVAAFPRVATRMPRPGRWMIHLRIVLGFGLAGTAVWLLLVLAAQAGPGTALATAFLMLAAGALLALARRRPGRLAPAGAALALVAAVAVPTLADAPPPAESPGSGPVAWHPFDRGALRTRVAEGRTVFVDVSAAWCPTCRINARVVLDRAPTTDRLAAGHVVPMRADWTRPDPAVGAYLASYGRYGVPFTIVYGPGAPQGLVLPEILTAATVRDGLARAGGRADDRAGTDGALSSATRPRR